MSGIPRVRFIPLSVRASERKRERERRVIDSKDVGRWYVVFVDDGVRTKGLINNGSIKGLSNLSRGSRTGATSDT